MELVVGPEHLQAAALALARAAATVDDAALTFTHRAAIDTPRLGTHAVAGVARVNAGTAGLVQSLSEDVGRLSEALSALATHYPHVDASAVPARALPAP